MKCNFTSVIVVLIVLVAGFAPVPSHARLPSPPPQLTSIFDDLSVFESAFKSGNWDKAISATGRINKTFRQMLPQLKRELHGDTEKIYSGIFNKIVESVENRNTAKTQFNFIELHYFIFTLINKYEYNTPPVVVIINKYIMETEEALHNNNYKRVVSEMDEILSMLSFVENHMVRNDSMRGDVEEIKAKIRGIRVAGQNRQNGVVKNAITSLKKNLADLLIEIKRTEKL